MFWVVLTLVFAAGGLLLGWYGRKCSRLWGNRILILTALYIAVMTVSVIILWEGSSDENVQVDYGLLLGCCTDDGRPSAELILRMELALDWLRETEEIPLVISGGDPGGTGTAEAKIMRNWLEARGAPMERILLEDMSRDTRENICGSRKIVMQMGKRADKVMLLTSGYHLTRARYLVERMGQTAFGRGCGTDFASHLCGTVREVYAFVGELLEGLFPGLRL